MLQYVFILQFASIALAQTTEPALTSWIKSTGRGYNNYLTNVQKIDYSANYVYIKAASIPSYSIGPWKANPNSPTDLNSLYKIPRKPKEQTGAKTAVPLGAIGIWSNGVTMFNADDAQSYNNKGIWKRNAYVFEKISFDSCNGHPAPNGAYHHHVNPICLYNTKDNTNHSPIIGYAFDGFPVYGPFGYSNPLDKNSSIKRIQSSYKTRAITVRQTLPTGTTLSSDNYGPDVGSTYPIGSFLQDHEYIKGYGDLDEHNGRFTITPEYPAGTYAYFVATDSNGNPAYPFTIGPYYYGVTERSNFGPNPQKNTISETPSYNYYTYQ